MKMIKKSLQHFLMSKSTLSSYLVVVLATVVYTTLNMNNIVFEANIDSGSPNKADIFWSDSPVFQEHQKYTQDIRNGVNRIQKPLLQFSVAFQYIRIDSVLNSGAFNVADPAIIHKDCLFFVRFLCQTDLLQENIANLNGVSVNDTGAYLYDLEEIDSYTVWKLTPHHGTTAYVYILNIFLILVIYSLLFFLSKGLLRYRKTAQTDYVDSRKQTKNILTFLLAYPIFYGLSSLLGRYFDVSSLQVYAYLFLLISFCYFSWLEKSFSLPAPLYLTPTRIATAFIICVAIIPHILFRFDAWEKWPTGTREVGEYHWKFNRTFQDNYQNSSLKYLSELEEIAEILPAKSVFLSDQATSYYITSYLHAYTRNPMSHHRYEEDEQVYFLEQQTIDKICALEQNQIDEILTTLSNANIGYLIINRDLSNEQVKHRCIAKSLSNQISLYPEIFDIVYQGTFLTVFKVNFHS